MVASSPNPGAGTGPDPIVVHPAQPIVVHPAQPIVVHPAQPIVVQPIVVHPAQPIVVQPIVVHPAQPIVVHPAQPIVGLFSNIKEVKTVSLLPAVTPALSTFMSLAPAGHVRQHVLLENCRKYNFTDSKSGVLKQGITFHFSSGVYGDIQEGVEKGCILTTFSAGSDLLGNIDVAYTKMGRLPRVAIIELTFKKDSMKLTNFWFASEVGGVNTGKCFVEGEGGAT